VIFTSREVADAVQGQLAQSDIQITGATTDTRSVVAGQLFVPLVAERDGHDFIDVALSKGASAYLTERDDARSRAIVVDDTARALFDLTAHAVSRLRCSTIGITGSVGKTTTKDLLAAVLRTDRTTYASAKSFNNSIGLPITVLNAPDDVEALVLEMGANAPGEIDQLCQLAKPTVGIVTRVAPAHTLGFGDINGVASAKSELVRALPSSGTAVLNADDERVVAMRSATTASVITYGQAGDIRVRLIELTTDLRPRIHVDSPWGAFETTVAARGVHQVTNAGAVAAAAGALGVEIEKVAAGLSVAEVSGMRMDLRQCQSGLQLLDDSYNANPASVEAALNALAALKVTRRIAILGTMAELGSLSETEHRRMTGLARALDIEVIAVDAPEYGAQNVPDIESAATVIESMKLGPGDALLVKGSRVAGLESLARRLDNG
jgi:UDP-N-acetylmuramoyl-tripeptide--D-alanyl-D-alanine ligase